MDIFILAITAAAATGAGAISSLVTSFKVTERVQWKPQTKVERLQEQKELGRWLVLENAKLATEQSISKEKITKLLYQLHILYSSANLTVLSNHQIKETINAASTALHMAESIDRRYMLLLARLIDGVVTTILRTSGEKEGIHMAMKTVESLRGLAAGFRSYSGGEAQIAEWKKEIFKDNQKDKK